MATNLPTSLRQLADRITAHWHKAYASIMEAARLCADANKNLDAGDKTLLISALPFDRSTFSKLAQIGADRRLQSAKVQKLLPPNYSIIYSVTQLEDNEFKAAIKEGIVNPTLKRADLEKWREEHSLGSSKEEHGNKAKPRIFFAAIRLPEKGLSDKQHQRLQGLLHQIQTEFNAEIMDEHQAIEMLHARTTVRMMRQRVLNDDGERK
jgi:hypothetical protein